MARYAGSSEPVMNPPTNWHTVRETAIVEKARRKDRKAARLNAANGEDRELFVYRITGSR